MTESAFTGKWQAEAARLEALEASVNGAKLCRDILRDFETLCHARDSAVVDLTEAAAISGYSKAHLMRLVKQGTVPTLRAPGSRGRLRFHRRDLPRKPGRDHTPDTGVHELASRLFGGREAPYGQS